MAGGTSNENTFWCNLDPNRIWRAPTPTPSNLPTEKTATNNENLDSNPLSDQSLMMRLTHNTSCISLSALEEQPSGSSATIFPPPVTRSTQRRPAPLEDQLLVNMQNVSIFSTNDLDFASLGIQTITMNPWQPNSLSFGTSSTNGFTCSDTSSAPISPTSSPGYKKQTAQGNGNHQQMNQRIFNNKNQTHLNHFRNNRGNGNHQNSHHQQNYPNANRINRDNGGINQSTVVPTSKNIRAYEEHKPGMRDLGYWLKQLRLHKYYPLFQDMTYRQLMSLSNANLERMKVTNGARKKIVQSIEKLHERPGLLKSLEFKLKNGTQCVRCAICSIRQLLWSPFMKYEGGNRKLSTDIIDGFNLPAIMISDDNLPALIFRVIEILNHMIFPLHKSLLDLEDEYMLTMFHMFESVMKNESFTPNQQRRAFLMKKNAKSYANPEEIRRHRMGMVSSAQCEGCHHAEVVNRERLMEFQERQMRQARGEAVGLPTFSSCSTHLDLNNSNGDARIEFNIPPVSQAQRIQKRPALLEDDEWLAGNGSPKITAASPSDSVIFENFVLPQMQSTNFWENAENIWRNQDHKPSTSFRFPSYRRPDEMNEEPSKIEDNKSIDPLFNFLQVLANDTPVKKSSLSDFNIPETVSSSNRANSTGSGYSSSESESSIITSPCVSVAAEEIMHPPVYGINQVLYSSTFQFL